jgi:acetyl esterase/lipase
MYGFNSLSKEAKSGEQVYYDIYSPEQKKENPTLNDTGLFVLKGKNPDGSVITEKKPFVLLLAGGGYNSVCTSVESLPVAAAFSNMGYTSFAAIYRFGENAEPRTKFYEDVAQAIKFIIAHADEFNVETEGYLIGGFSAGGNLAGRWCTEEFGYAKYGLPKPAAVCLIYGNYTPVDANSPPAYMLRAAKTDPIDAPTIGFKKVKEEYDAFNISYTFREVDVSHGFGLGLGTEAEGWEHDALAFWQEQQYIQGE